MEIFLMYFLFVVGVVLIVKGGDWFVDGAVWLAEVTKIPKFIIGATIISVATTLPEIKHFAHSRRRGLHRYRLATARRKRERDRFVVGRFRSDNRRYDSRDRNFASRTRYGYYFDY